MNAFLKFRADRAFSDGMRAYRACHEPRAPAHYGEHSGDWVRGWNVACLAERIRPQLQPQPPSTVVTVDSTTK